MITIQGDLHDFYILEPVEEIPQEWKNLPGNRYFLQGINAFVFKNDGFVSTVEKLDNSNQMVQKFFNKIKTQYSPEKLQVTSSNLSNIKFKTEDFAYIMRYFQWVFETYKSESCVVLLASPTEPNWIILPCLQYEASGGTVKYIYPMVDIDLSNDVSPNKEIHANPEAATAQRRVNKIFKDLASKGYRIYGTIHSHCDFSAYHSSVDDRDEENFDGLHITIGNVRKDQAWSYAARIMVRGKACKIENLDLLLDGTIKEAEEIAATLEPSQEDKDLMFPTLLRKPKEKAKRLYPRQELLYEANVLDPASNFTALYNTVANEFFIINNDDLEEFYEQVDQNFIEYNLVDVLNDALEADYEEIEEEIEEEEEEDPRGDLEIPDVFCLMSNNDLNPNHTEDEVKIVDAD